MVSFSHRPAESLHSHDVARVRKGSVYLYFFFSTHPHNMTRMRIDFLGAATILWKTSRMTENGNTPRPSPAFGRDELNLIDFPIGTLSNKQPVDSSGNRVAELVFTVNNFDDDLGCVVPKRLTTRTSSKHGFPTPKEEQLLVGLMLLTRVKNNFSNPRVEFRPGELYQLMNWPNDSTSKRQLKVGLDRLSGVKLKYENSWSTSSGETYEKEFLTGLLDSYMLTTPKVGQAHRSITPCWVQWSAEVFADIQAGNVKELNTNQFFALKYPLTRRMYRFLDKHLTDTPQLEMDLLTFAAHLGIAETKHVGKIKDRLRNALLELESIPGFTQPLPPTERFHKLGRGQWVVRFLRAGEAIPSPRAPGKNKADTRKDDGHAHSLVKEFHRLWSNNGSHRPSYSELQHSESIIDEHGIDQCRELLPELVKLMRTEFAEARWFGATQAFWSQVVKQRTKQATTSQRSIAEQQRKLADQQVVEKQKQRRQELRTIWNELSDENRSAIRLTVRAAADGTVRRKIDQLDFEDTLVEIACLRLMESRMADGSLVL